MDSDKSMKMTWWNKFLWVYLITMFVLSLWLMIGTVTQGMNNYQPSVHEDLKERNYQSSGYR